jgi:hypothetical protein
VGTLVEALEEAFSDTIILAGVCACGKSELPHIVQGAKAKRSPHTQARRKHFGQRVFNMAVQSPDSDAEPTPGSSTYVSTY